MIKEHAQFSPSGAEKWINCSGSLALEKDLPNVLSTFSIEGSIAHQIAEDVLKNRLLYTQKKINIFSHAYDYIGNYSISIEEKIFHLDVTEEMSMHIQNYIDFVWNMSKKNKLFIEQKVDFSHIIGIPNQFGTADAIIFTDTELQIHDLKYGFLKVSARKNKQLQLYALAAWNKFKNQKFKNIRLFIHQPRLNHTSEWLIDKNILIKFSNIVKTSVKKVLTAITISNTYGVEAIPRYLFHPGKKQCFWCKASGGYCKAEAEYYLNFITKKKVDFDNDLKSQIKNISEYIASLNLKQLEDIFHNLDGLDRFIKLIRNRVTNELKLGKKFLKLKLLENISGHRMWHDEIKVEKLLESFKVSRKKRYISKLISPLQAEKLLKNKHPKQWHQLKSFIVRNKKLMIIRKQDI